MRDRRYYCTGHVRRLIDDRDSANPILSKVIEEALGVPGSAIRDAVRELRRAGEPIIATERGYYLATRPEEVQIVLHDLQARIASMSKTITALRSRYYERTGRQLAFDFRPACPGVSHPQHTAADGADETSTPARQKGDMFYVPADRDEDAHGRFSEVGADGTSDALLLADLKDER